MVDRAVVGLRDSCKSESCPGVRQESHAHKNKRLRQLGKLPTDRVLCFMSWERS